jgi:LacI family transcriptional regulator
MLMADGVPVVQADRCVGVASDSVRSDNSRGAREMTQHLIGPGHERIALLLDEMAWTTGKGRLAGFRAAMRHAKLPVDRELITNRFRRRIRSRGRACVDGPAP